MNTAISTTESKKGKIPIIEIFGPVIQGEGAMIGLWTSFIRTGGCDYHCTKCDSMHAVDPKQVKQNATWMTPDEVADAIITGNPIGVDKAPWVTLSGGNPAMWDFSRVISRLHDAGYRIAIETQGSIWEDWIRDCDQITVSPKPHGMGDSTELILFDIFMRNLLIHEFDPKDRRLTTCIKIPVFEDLDLDFAEDIVNEYGNIVDIYLSLGNSWPPEVSEALRLSQEILAMQLLKDYEVLAEKIASRPLLVRHTTFLPQLHVLVYGNARRK